MSKQDNIGLTREEFPDGSALVTYQDGSQMIVETKLAKAQALGDGRPLTYNDPPPPPPGPTHPKPGANV